MGVKSLKLDKKDSTIRFAIDGYLPRRYWHEALSNLPPAKRERHFNVHYEWGNPDAPISIYCGDEFICDASPINSIPFIDKEGSKVKEHMEAKGAYLKPRTKFISKMKLKGGVALDQLESSETLSLPPISPSTQRIIAPSTKQQVKELAPNPLKLMDGSNSEFISTKTGKSYTRIDLARVDSFTQEQRELEAKQARLEELKRKKLEKDLAHQKAG